MKTKQKFFILLLVIIIVAAIFAVRQREKKASPIKIGVLTSWILEGPFYVAQEQGFFDHPDKQVELVSIGSVDEFVLALMSKEVLAAELIADMFIVQAAQEPSIRQIMRKATIFGVDGIVATESIKTPQDLKGQKIAVQTISPSHYLLLNVLKDAGLTSDDVTILPTEAGAAGAAFVSGGVDVAVTWEPWLSRATEREGGHILTSTKDSPELIYDILITRDGLTDEEREDIKFVLRGWYKAVEWMEQNPEETVEIFARNLKLPAEEVEFFFTKLKFMSHEDNLKFYGRSDNLGPVEAYTNTAAQMWLSEGIIKSKPDTNSIIDPNYLNELYQ